MNKKPSMRLVGAAVTLPIFLSITAQTMLAAAFPEIGAGLGELSRLPWLVIAFMFALTVAGPVSGSLGDMFGRRRMLLWANVIFCIGSVMAALAPNFEFLTVARIVQGVGAGALFAISQALIAQNVESKERGRMQGYVATVGVVASSAGPVIGGGLTYFFGWQSIFWAGLPFAALALIPITALPADTRSGGESRTFDYVGFVWLNAFVASWVLGLEFLKDASVSSLMLSLAFGVLGLLCLLLLIRTERRVQSPIFPPRLIALPAIHRSYALAFCHGAGLITYIAFLPLYMRLVHHAGIVGTSSALLALTVGLGIGGVVTGNLITRTGRVAIFPSVGLFISASLIAVVAIFGHAMNLQALCVSLFLTGLCMGTVMSVVHVSTQHVVGADLRGAAAGGVTFSRSMGSVLGTAAVTVVMLTSIAGSGLGQDGLENLAAGLGEVSEASLPAWRTAFTFTLLSIAAFIGMGGLVANFIPVRRV